MWTLALIPALIITLGALSQTYNLQQFAALTYNTPPLFGCLQVGEGSSDQCGSKLGVSTESSLTLHGRPLVDQTVYYGDRIYGSVTYKNVGDLPIELGSISMAATSKENKEARESIVLSLNPPTEKTSLKSGESITAASSSYLFQSPDPSGPYTVNPLIKTPQGQLLPTDNLKRTIGVSSACTALRAKELSPQDKQTIVSYCDKNPKSKLCSSKQYCEIFKGGNCPQANVSQELEGQQCDVNVVLYEKEQELLEDLCKTHPNTDVCKDFCDRSLGSKICPARTIEVYTATGLPVSYAPQNTNLSTKNQAVAGVMIAATATPNGTCVNCATKPGLIGDASGVKPITPKPAAAAPAKDRIGTAKKISATGSVGGTTPNNAPVAGSAGATKTIKVSVPGVGSVSVRPAVPLTKLIQLTTGNAPENLKNKYGTVCATGSTRSTVTGKCVGREIVSYPDSDKGVLSNCGFNKTSGCVANGDRNAKYDQILEEAKKGAVTIIGHGDSVGTYNANLSVGKKRAEEEKKLILDYCRSKPGCDVAAVEKNLKTTTRGDSDLRDVNGNLYPDPNNITTPEGSANSRRTEWLPGDHTKADGSASINVKTPINNGGSVLVQPKPNTSTDTRDATRPEAQKPETTKSDPAFGTSRKGNITVGGKSVSCSSGKQYTEDEAKGCCIGSQDAYVGVQPSGSNSMYYRCREDNAQDRIGTINQQEKTNDTIGTTNPQGKMNKEDSTPSQPEAPKTVTDAGVACNTTNPSTCQSGKCLPTGPSSGTNGACAAK